MDKKLKLVAILAVGILFSSGIFSCKKKINDSSNSSISESAQSESSSEGHQTSDSTNSSIENFSSSLDSSNNQSSLNSSSEVASSSSSESSESSSESSSSTQLSDSSSSTEDKYGISDVMFNDQTYSYSKEGVKLEAKCFDTSTLNAKYYYNNKEVTTLNEVGEYLITCKIYCQGEVVYQKDATIKIEKIKLPIPYQKEGIIEDGKVHYVELENYDSNLMSLSGDYYASRANSYSAKVSLIDPEHYMWEKTFDGIVNWNINYQDSKNMHFSLSEDKTYYILTNCNEYSQSSISVPAYYNNLPVREIACRAFYYTSI